MAARNSLLRIYSLNFTLTALRLSNFPLTRNGESSLNLFLALDFLAPQLLHFDFKVLHFTFKILWLCSVTFYSQTLQVIFCAGKDLQGLSFSLTFPNFWT